MKRILSPAEVAAMSGPEVQIAIKLINRELLRGNRKPLVMTALVPAIQAELETAGWVITEAIELDYDMTAITLRPRTAENDAAALEACAQCLGQQ